MTEPAIQRRFPWGLVLTVAALTGGLLLVLRTTLWRESPAPWPTVGATILAATAAFLTFRWLQNYFWGVLTALVLTLHPVFFAWTATEPQPVFAEALQLTALTLVVYSWRFAFVGRFVWPTWLIVLPVLTLTLDEAWLTEPMTALIVFLLAGPALLGGALLAGLRRRGDPSGSSPWNVVVGGVGAVLVPSLSLVVVPPLLALLREVGWHPWPLPAPEQTSLDLLHAAFGDVTTYYPTGFQTAQLEQWAGPLPWWLVLAFAVWGLWRSVRRGRKQRSEKRPAVAWVLSLYALFVVVAVFLHSDRAQAVSFLPLTSLSVLLIVFCVADLFRGLGESLVLAPPHEVSEGEAE